MSLRHSKRRSKIGLALLIGLLGVTPAVFDFSNPVFAADNPTRPNTERTNVEQASTERAFPHIGSRYAVEIPQAGGHWHSYVTAVGEGSDTVVIDDDADHVISGASVQKLAVAVAVMAKVERGELKLSDKLELDQDSITGGSGTYHLQAEIGDQLTLANLLVLMLQTSDNTAVRMFSKVLPGAEINQILEVKGFVHTRVRPIEGDPRQFWLGTTTPRETHALLAGLANGTLLSAESAEKILRIMRWSSVGYNDGIRRVMSSAERGQVATKHGADDDRRHEVGIIFNAENKPAIIYAFFAGGLADVDNYGSTHPAVEVHAVLGRPLLDAAFTTAGTGKSFPLREFSRLSPGEKSWP